jgi:hypothetical protein
MGELSSQEMGIPSGNQTWLAGKSSVCVEDGKGFNGKIGYKWWIFHLLSTKMECVFFCLTYSFPRFFFLDFCFPVFFLLCFSACLLLQDFSFFCFAAFCVSAFPCFFASLLFCFSLLLCFSASLLFCLSAFLAFCFSSLR